MNRGVYISLIVSIGTAISLGIAALSMIHEAEKRIAVLEHNVTVEREMRAEPQPQPAPSQKQQQVFYAGTDLSRMLDEPILGAPLFGDLDQYDIIHPAILAEGSVLVRGSGRVVLDGDASDLILKIDNEYYSLRELFGIGPGIFTTPRDNQDNPGRINYNFDITQLCSGISVIPAVSCPLRRNFGTDSCNEENTLCYCGAGYDYLTQTYRHRHLVCPENVNCTDIFFGKNISAYCCAPGANPESFYCKTAWDTIQSDVATDRAYWVDRFANCPDYVAGTVCLSVDQDEALNTYAIAGIGEALLNDPQALVLIREKLNLHAWGITRDYVFDDGNQYHIELSNDVYGDCPEPRLSMSEERPLKNAFVASWECNQEGSPITFTRANDRSVLDEYESRKWGALYTLLVKSENDKAWYCLTKGPLTQKERATYIGQAFPGLPDQVYFVKKEDTAPCATVYLGNRDVGDHKEEKSIGFSVQDPNRVVVVNPDLDEVQAYAVVPV